MIPRDPYETEDYPSAEETCCDMCSEPIALEVDQRYGPRKLLLCESHADRWLKAEREMDAELEQMRGREEQIPLSASLYGMARRQDARCRGGRRGPRCHAHDAIENGLRRTRANIEKLLAEARKRAS